MSSKKRREARRLHLALRAYEQSWRKPSVTTLFVACTVRRGEMLKRYSAADMRILYRWHLTVVGIDPSVIARTSGGLVLRRVP